MSSFPRRLPIHSCYTFLESSIPIQLNERTEATLYGTPAVLPMEIVVPPIRVALQHCLAADDYTSYSLRELEGADEARLKALDSLKLRHELRESIKKK